MKSAKRVNAAVSMRIVYVEGAPGIRCVSHNTSLRDVLSTWPFLLCYCPRMMITGSVQDLAFTFYFFPYQPYP